MNTIIKKEVPQKTWFVYIILGTDGNYYTGITTDVQRRWQEHCGANGKSLGAKYFRGRKPLQLVYVESQLNRSGATKRECQIKKLSKSHKQELIIQKLNQIAKFPSIKSIR
ncbi:MAG: endonuclease [Gammaproteobacteria bacterium CG22_combo_CG10-13_8_21_14_all_40_8]|nr:MAG: endonuclease [Gammaproteobacteria bacterium CG22_combo_CG10-13_8_21_14_all_40_8]